MAAKTPRKRASNDGATSTTPPKAEQASATRPSGRSLAIGTLSAGALIGAVVAALFGASKLGKRSYTDGQPLAPGAQPDPAPTPAEGPAAAQTAQTPGSAEHVPTDLMSDKHPGFEDRAVDAFRPDPTAPIPDGERDAFRPALAGSQAPTLVAGQAQDNQRLNAMPS
ncbi:hypothetical protein [Sphingomonas xinjiangensis]|uniref:Uncharacterized protein n=1 Tax=Sphingomonas xinjiangensis TaxID=643568 RepID=A0A840YQ84_9SPHN|nr:hypothetical protein [Sphingomonas xinjiangensis]MBB5710193.1 hypothetical protein [Sphingomonas xinjiangensis]